MDTIQDATLRAAADGFMTEVLFTLREIELMWESKDDATRRRADKMFRAVEGVVQDTHAELDTFEVKGG